MILIDEKTGKPISVGDKVISFRGEEYRVTGWAVPYKPESTGRMYVRQDGDGHDSAYFPSVFDCKFVEAL